MLGDLLEVISFADSGRAHQWSGLAPGADGGAVAACSGQGQGHRGRAQHPSAAIWTLFDDILTLIEHATRG